MNKNQDNIFIEQKNSEKSQDIRIEERPFPSIPYLKRGDSTVYIQQFLDNEEDIPPKKQNKYVSKTPTVKEDIKAQNAHSDQESNQEEQELPESRSNPSAFHNFQKHLTVALKHAIILPTEDKITKDYVRAAAKLWKVFAQSKICTKKVLHFLLGERNEHQITTEDLRQFGFAKIYDSFGEKIIREGRSFLMKQVLRQIKQGCLQNYFEHKKIKDKFKFKKYMQMFIEQLEQGFLRKRLPRQKVAELIA